MEYTVMQKFLDDNKVTSQVMQKKWDSLINTNRIVKNLHDNGKNWTDLSTHLLNSLIKLTKEIN